MSTKNILVTFFLVIALFGVALSLRQVSDSTVVNVNYTDHGFIPNSLTITPPPNIAWSLVFHNESSKPFQPIGDKGQSSTCIDDRFNAQFGACGPIPPGGSLSDLIHFGGVWVYHDALNPPAGNVTIMTNGLQEVSPGAVITPIESFGPLQ